MSWLTEGLCATDRRILLHSYVLRIQNNTFTKKEMKFWKWFCLCKTWSSDMDHCEDKTHTQTDLKLWWWSWTRLCGITLQKTEGQVLFTLPITLHVTEPILPLLSASVKEDPKFDNVTWQQCSNFKERIVGSAEFSTSYNVSHSSGTFFTVVWTHEGAHLGM